MFALIEALQLHIVTGFIATAAFLSGVRGLFVHVLHPERKEAFHLVMVLVLVIAASVLRTVNWDLARVILSDQLVDVWREATRGLAFNALNNAVLVWAAYHLHRLIWLLLPYSEQRNYSIWTAWLYPLRLAGTWPGRKLQMICQALRKRK